MPRKQPKPPLTLNLANQCASSGMAGTDAICMLATLHTYANHASKKTTMKQTTNRQKSKQTLTLFSLHFINSRQNRNLAA